VGIASDGTEVCSLELPECCCWTWSVRRLVCSFLPAACLVRGGVVGIRIGGIAYCA
jgi:hypothetical protein